MGLNTHPLIEVVVPNWNGIRVLPGCLRSLCDQTFASLQVTVVDNGSTDGSVEHVRECYPQVRTLPLQRNYGFCRAVNEAVRGSRAPLIAVLNNDAEADTRWLEELYRSASVHTHAGSFASKILQYDDPGRIESVGDMLKADGCGVNRGRGELDCGQYDQEVEVFAASGAAALYRRSMVEKIGLFDEQFFAYFEDIDIGYRAQRFGFPCIFVPKARVYHRGKYSRSDDRAWHLRQEFVNSTVCQIKNIPLQYGIRNLANILEGHLRSVKGLVKEGSVGVLIASEKELILRLPRAIQQRFALSLRSRGRFDRLALFLPAHESTDFYKRTSA